jgi:hypothetical protein
MRPKIRCDGWKRKYFGYAWEVNTPIDDRVGAFFHAVTLSYEVQKPQTIPVALRQSQ